MAARFKPDILKTRLAIHGLIWAMRFVSMGSPSVAGSSGSFGCIGLSPRDARDVYDILATGAKVSIVR